MTVLNVTIFLWEDEHCSTLPALYVFVPQDKFLEAELLGSEYAHLCFCYSLCLLGFNCCCVSAVNLYNYKSNVTIFKKKTSTIP